MTMKANAPLRARSAIRLLICRSPALLLFALAILPLRSETRILVIAGPTDHPPGTHEVAASARLLGHCLSNLEGFPDIRTEVSHGWPQDDAVLEKAATLVSEPELSALLLALDQEAQIAGAEAARKLKRPEPAVPQIDS